MQNSKVSIAAGWLLIGTVLLFSSIGAWTGCSSLSCRVDSQNEIEWGQKPQIIDGYLEMRGKTKGNARIHDTAGTTGRIYVSAFDLYNYNEESENDPEYLEGIGSIWPNSIRSNIVIGKGDVVAEKYEVTSSSFDIRAKLPQFMLNDGVRLVVGVWEQDPRHSEKSLGAACAIQQSN